MQITVNSRTLFALTHPFEVVVLNELRDYFESMYFAN